MAGPSVTRTRFAKVDCFLKQHCIDHAIQNNSSHCMYAESIQEDHPHFRRVSVDLQTIRWTDTRNKRRYFALTPALMQKVLVEWDGGTKPVPHAFGFRPIQSIKSQMAEKLSPDQQEQKRTTRDLREKKTLKIGDITSGGRLQVTGGSPPPKSNQFSARCQFGVRVYRGGNHPEIDAYEAAKKAVAEAEAASS